MATKPDVIRRFFRTEKPVTFNELKELVKYPDDYKYLAEGAAKELGETLD